MCGLEYRNAWLSLLLRLPIKALLKSPFPLNEIMGTNDTYVENEHGQAGIIHEVLFCRSSGNSAKRKEEGNPSLSTSSGSLSRHHVKGHHPRSERMLAMAETSALLRMPESLIPLPNCCYKYNDKVLPKNRVAGYKEALNCYLPAIIFVTKKNREVCANPNEEWVKEYIKDSKIPLMPQSTVS
ncbi:C-C motif chemokine 16 [Sigmodon hispidus]